MKNLDKTFIIVIPIVMIIYGICIILNEQGIPCYFHKITGLFCPGCGITRMFISILNLELYQAFRYNPLIFVLLIGFIIFIAVDILYFSKNKKHINIPIKFYVCLIIITIAFGILRNISIFSYLAPTVVN